VHCSVMEGGAHVVIEAVRRHARARLVHRRQPRPARGGLRRLLRAAATTRPWRGCSSARATIPDMLRG
jgi:hypothetical protein